MTAQICIGVIADDFTGASDIANTLQRAGARTVLLAGGTAASVPAGFDAAVVALKSRSIEKSAAVTQSLAACRLLVAAGARQILFKYCSTFDSTPEGNIGPVAEALLAELDAPLALVCPAFPANRRTVYQGHLFVGDQLLNQSGMEHHPLNPMTDPDIRRWLGQQTPLALGHLPLDAIRSGDAAAALAALQGSGSRLVVADAVEDGDLYTLARAAKDHWLVTGGSAIATGLPMNFGITPGHSSQAFHGLSGPALVLSGSCSRATLAQIARYQTRRPFLRLDDRVLTDPGAECERVMAFLGQHRLASPLIYSSAGAAEVAAQQAKFGAAPLAHAIETLFAQVARQAVAQGFQRIVVAGGETSSAVASAIGSGSFAIGPEIAKGVPVLTVLGGPPLVVALKSGNFGDDGFFDQALDLMETPA